MVGQQMSWIHSTIDFQYVFAEDFPRVGVCLICIFYDVHKNGFPESPLVC